MTCLPRWLSRSQPTLIRLALALDCKVVELVSIFDKTDLRSLLPK